MDDENFEEENLQQLDDLGESQEQMHISSGSLPANKSNHKSYNPSAKSNMFSKTNNVNNSTGVKGYNNYSKPNSKIGNANNSNSQTVPASRGLSNHFNRTNNASNTNRINGSLTNNKNKNIQNKNSSSQSGNGKLTEKNNSKENNKKSKVNQGAADILRPKKKPSFFSRDKNQQEPLNGSAVLSKIAKILLKAKWLLFGCGIVFIFFIVFVLLFILLIAILGKKDDNDGSSGGGSGFAGSTTSSVYCTEGVSVINNDGSAVGTYDLETYVEGVISAEIASTVVGRLKGDDDAINEALKAKAVAIRTYTISRTNNCSKSIRDSSNDQNFDLPEVVEKSSYNNYITKAASETAGVILTDSNGNYFSPEYDAFCYTEKNDTYYVLSQQSQKIPKSWVDSNVSSYSWKNNRCGTDGDGGHGRGLSQYGTIYLASSETEYKDHAHYTYKEILLYYYGSDKNITQTGVTDEYSGSSDQLEFMCSMYSPLTANQGIERSTPERVTSLMGLRAYQMQYHLGIDLGEGKGHPIYAVQPGEVVTSGYHSSYGNYIVIDHGNFSTLYAHMSKAISKKGDSVSKGTKIGEVGSTGNSTGNHLHFEIRDSSGVQLSPNPYFGYNDDGEYAKCIVKSTPANVRNAKFCDLSNAPSSRKMGIAGFKAICNSNNNNVVQNIVKLDSSSGNNYFMYQGKKFLIANKEYALSSSYVPSLVTASGSYSVTRETLNAYNNMVSAAANEGITLYISSAYRSYSTQKTTYEGWVRSLGQTEADRISMPAGHSEHQLGTTIDFNVLDESFANTKEGKWLYNNAYKYGFILRYPKDTEKITGIAHEPWHYRYVGTDTDLAKRLYNGGNWLAIEEILNRL